MAGRPVWLLSSIGIALGALIVALALVGRSPGGSALSTRDSPPKASSAKGPNGRVLFIGSTYFGESHAAGTALATLLARGGYHVPVAGLAPLLQAVDFTVAGLEAPLTNRTDSPLHQVKERVHRGHPVLTVAEFARANISVVSLANSHAYDFLDPGLADTCQALDSRGIGHFGAGIRREDARAPYRHDLRLPGSVLELAILGVAESRDSLMDQGYYATQRSGGVHRLDETEVTRQIAELKAAEPTRFLVVYPHWGKPYGSRTRTQQRLAHRMVEAGADLVLGHGTHSYQAIERYRERWIVYSLGDGVFLGPLPQPPADGHALSLAAELTARDRSPQRLALKLRFLLSDLRKTEYVPRLLRPAEFEQAERELLARSIDPAEPTLPLRHGHDVQGDYLEIELGPFPRP